MPAPTGFYGGARGRRFGIQTLGAVGYLKRLIKATGTTVARSLAARFAQIIWIEDFGATGDALGPVTVAMTNGSANCTRSSGSWVNATAPFGDVGKLIVVAGTGSGGAALCTTIASISSATVAVLTVAASTSQASTS